METGTSVRIQKPRSGCAACGTGALGDPGRRGVKWRGSSRGWLCSACYRDEQQAEKDKAANAGLTEAMKRHFVRRFGSRPA